MIKKHIFYIFSFFLVLSCQQKTDVVADTVITNAKIYSLSWDDPNLKGFPAENAPFKNGEWSFDAETIAIKNDSILYVGNAEKLQNYIGESTQIIDAKGAFVIPGLIESHGHLNEIGEKKEAIKLQGLSQTAIIELIEKIAKTKPEGEWIVASGWDEAEFANDYPNMLTLSKKTPKNPVVLIGLRGFGVMGNSLAFEKAGITKKTIPEKGGVILLDDNDNLKYVLLNGAKRLLLDKIPQKTLKQQIKTMNYGFEKLIRLGFTTTHHLGVENNHMKVYEHLLANNTLPMRVHAFVAARKYNINLVNEWLQKGPTQNNESFLNVRGFKGYYDGSLGSRGAKFLEDYSDKNGVTGVSGLAYGFDENLMIKALDKGFQLAIHAIGDKANRDVLDLYETYFNDNPSSKTLRHRIEHVQVVNPDDFNRFSKLNLIASMEPAHAVEDMPWAIERVGLERVKGAYAWRTLRKNKAKIIFNSDFTGSDPSFFYGMYCAITKKKLPSKQVFFKEQALTKEETLRAYTIWGAYASHQEKLTGTIEVGKWADFTFIDVDVLNANPEEILKGKVLKTMINGKVVFENDKEVN